MPGEKGRPQVAPISYPLFGFLRFLVRSACLDQAFPLLVYLFLDLSNQSIVKMSVAPLPFEIIRDRKELLRFTAEFPNAVFNLVQRENP